MYKLFLDDLRAPPDGTWVVARSVASAIEYVKAYGLPHTMSLDHDLGGAEDAPVFVRWLGDENDIHQVIQIRVHIHTANPVGRKNLQHDWANLRRLAQLCTDGYFG